LSFEQSNNGEYKTAGCGILCGAEMMRQGMGVVIAAHNEESTIAKVLGALNNQTLKPDVVVVVDDGSVDETPTILANAVKNCGFDLKIVTLPHHVEDKATGPGLWKVFDSGLEIIRGIPQPPKYVMKLDADHLLPGDYIEKIVARMDADLRLMVASGYIEGDPYVEHAPTGSSFVVRAEFWRRVNGMQFEDMYSWEQWVYFRAMQLGFRTQCFRDMRTQVLRKTSLKHGVFFGRGMYELGYDWRYVIGRCIIMARLSPSLGVHMFAGYLAPGEIKRLEISSWVGEWQRSQLPKIFMRTLRSVASSNRNQSKMGAPPLPSDSKVKLN
jgi:glycosyltransferase involved in cell wall biosynthesis